MEKLNDEEFKKFFEWLPARTRLLFKVGMVSKKVMESWLNLYQIEKETK